MNDVVGGDGGDSNRLSLFPSSSLSLVMVRGARPQRQRQY